MSRRAPCSFELNTELLLHVIPYFEDNYFYLLENRNSKQCAAVDPGAAAPLLDAVRRHQLQLTHILLTHHHRDHTPAEWLPSPKHTLTFRSSARTGSKFRITGMFNMCAG
ncbi:MAG: hypothetical protein EBR09_16490 [Proteobacteria bacterium]|nr:hypothetical protein [Pseudomonadota bacterium]